MAGATGFGRFTASSARAKEPCVSGKDGTTGSSGETKSKAESRSPQTARCQGLIPGMVMAKRRSKNCATDVWSKTWLLTQPPLLQGEITYIGTRGPSPQGRTVPEIVSSGCRCL